MPGDSFAVAGDRLSLVNLQVEDSWGILCIIHVLNVQCALLQLYIYSHYGVINEQVMPPLPRHEYGRMGAVCRRSHGMGNEKVKNKCGNF